MDEQNREQHSEKSLGEVIRHARRHEGVSQLYVAVSLGQKNVAFVSRLENGHVVPSLKIPSATLADYFSQTQREIKKRKVEELLQ